MLVSERVTTGLTTGDKGEMLSNIDGGQGYLTCLTNCSNNLINRTQVVAYNQL